MANNNVTSLLQSIKNIDKTKLSDVERKQVAAAAQDLVARVETPWETILRLIWVAGAEQASLKTLVDLKLFEKWVAAGDGVKTAKQLAELVNCNEVLMERLIRVLATTGLASNPGPHEFEMTDFSRSLADDSQSAAMRYWYDVSMPIYTILPA